MDGMYLGGNVPDRQSPCPIQCMFDLQGPAQDLVGQGLCRESVSVKVCVCVLCAMCVCIAVCITWTPTTYLWLVVVWWITGRCAKGPWHPLQVTKFMKGECGIGS